MKLLTKEMVLAKILADPERDWEESHDYWNGSDEAYTNAPNGWDVNVIGSTFAGVEDNEYLCVVTQCYKDEDGALWMTDDVIFCFYIEEA